MALASLFSAHAEPCAQGGEIMAIWKSFMGGRRAVLAAVAAIPLAFAAPKADAALTTALYLSMDGSGSISNSDFATQINGYVSALNTFFAANPAVFGQVAIGGNIFGENVIQFAPLTVITDAAALATLTTAISNLNPGRGGVQTGGTAIGDAVTVATNALIAFQTAQGPGTNLKLLIDVTTDGQNNEGLSPVTAANNAAAAGVDQVNCLGIGGGASCTWVGTNGTNFGTVSFANLGTALAAKIQAEVIGVPVPGALALFGVALAGLAAVRRRA
jgi:hypothetical protein